MTISGNDRRSTPANSASATSVSHTTLRRGAIGILTRDDRFLMIRRAPDIVLGGRWCFPGGHIESMENSKQAIVREFREELDIEIVPMSKLGYIRLIEAGYILALWQVSFHAGVIKPAPREISEFRWVMVDDIPTIKPGLPSNRIAYDMIKKTR